MCLARCFRCRERPKQSEDDVNFQWQGRGAGDKPPVRQTHARTHAHQVREVVRDDKPHGRNRERKMVVGGAESERK